ncbi:MAG: hypothetical protein J6B68_09280 [Lachnospiraceae bacterium]|nr:hypothetical protein [Lachnospiraceae bacterium]
MRQIWQGEIPSEVYAREKQKILMRENRKPVYIGVAIVCSVFLVFWILLNIIFLLNKEKGYEDYTIRKKQYYAEYTDEYDYWDVCTVEYPQIEGIDYDLAVDINKLMYDTAMDRAYYWHFKPDSDVRKLQEEYHIFCNDVRCDVTYHSQYLLSVSYTEVYAPVSPVYYTNITKRGLNIDLMTGEVYELNDILRIDENFIRMWCKEAHSKYGDYVYYDAETCDLLYDLFTNNADYIEDYYSIHTYFYVLDNKDLVIGLSMDPTAEGLWASEPQRDTYCVKIPQQELEKYKIESEFWNKYEQSESTGYVIPCEDLKSNIWLDEEGSVWSYWEEN